jgi:hypothetical protein
VQFVFAAGCGDTFRVSDRKSISALDSNKGPRMMSAKTYPMITTYEINTLLLLDAMFPILNISRSKFFVGKKIELVKFI